MKRPSLAPSRPGIYFFKNRRGKILYIGKAADLKSRLNFYGQKRAEARLQVLQKQTAKVEWQTTASEIEALLLEARLIKKHRPPFNVKLRDDKQYFYVIFTKERFPKIYVTHQPLASNRPVIISLGPFTDGTALRTVLKLLRRLFPFCTCRQSHYRLCLNAHLEKCPGYCCLKFVSSSPPPKLAEKKYQKNIKAIKKILSGEGGALRKQLTREMLTAAKRGDFLQAIERRDQITKLRRVFANARLVKTVANREKVLVELQNKLGLPKLPYRIEGYDVSHIQGQLAVGSMVVFIKGRPDKSQYRKFAISSPSSSKNGKVLTLEPKGDAQMLAEILRRRFHHPEWPLPDLIIVDGGQAQLNAALAVLKKTQGSSIIALAKDVQHRGNRFYLPGRSRALPLANLPPLVRHLLLEINNEAHRFAIHYYRHQHRRQIVNSVR